MPIYRLDAAQTLATNIDDAWEFFSNPQNLAIITRPRCASKSPAIHPQRSTQA